jgi:Zn-dependent protease with chaperone function
MMLLCDALEVAVFARLQSIKRPGGGWLFRLAYRNVLPFFFIISAIFEAGVADVRTGIFWYASGYLSYILLARLSRMLDLLFLTGRRLHSGDLHDRIFALAKQEGVGLNHLTVAETRSQNLANAAAMLGNDVLLTDYLLKHLTSAEVVALVAHELAHLRLRPLIFRTVTLVAVSVLGVYSLRWVGLPSGYLSLPVEAAVAMLLVYFFLRQFEYAADATAARWTRDPMALASAIIKVGHLNLAQLHWSPIEELLHSRPSVLRRVRAIARREHWPTPDLATIRQWPTMPQSPPAPGQADQSPSPY